MTPLAQLLNGIVHANPIALSLSKAETRATEYSKAARRGNWNDAWSSFDERKKAKANDDAAAGADEGDGGEGDMFRAAGMAAE